MDRKKPFVLLAALGGILALAALACKMPGIGQHGKNPLADIPDAQEHVSEEQLQAEIEATREEFFSDENFQGQKTYNSLENADSDNAADCDSGFPQGQDILIKQRYEGMGDDKVILWVGGETLIYEGTDKPYVFCRESHKIKFKDSDGNKEFTLYECVSFRNGGFDLTVSFYDSFLEEDVVCFQDEYTLTDTADEHIQAFNGEWFSPEHCEGDDEFPYQWTVSLTPRENAYLIGTIRFHSCGSGNVVYSVVGRVQVEHDSVGLSGTKISGAGALFDSAPPEQLFDFRPGGPPYPDLSK